MIHITTSTSLKIACYFSISLFIVAVGSCQPSATIDGNSTVESGPTSTQGIPTEVEVPLVDRTATSPPPDSSPTAQSSEHNDLAIDSGLMSTLPPGDYIIVERIGGVHDDNRPWIVWEIISIEGVKQGQLLRGGDTGAISQDGNKISFTERTAFSHNIGIHDFKRDKTTHLLTSSGCTDSSWSPSGDKLIASCGRIGSLYLLMIEIDEKELLSSWVQEGDSWIAPSWSNDGKWIASTLSTGSQAGDPRVGLYLIRADCVISDETCDEPFIGPFDVVSGDLDWSPESNKLAAAMFGAIQLLDVESGEIQSMDTALKAPVDSIAWSPDGKWIAYTQAGNDSFEAPEIYLLSLEDGRNKQITRDGEWKEVSFWFSVR